MKNDVNVSGKTVIFQWIPSNCGIFGNEMADKIAKIATKLFPQPERLISLNKTIASINAHFSKYWTTMWLTSENGKALKKILKKPNYLQLYSNIPRHVQTFASRARIGHIVTYTYSYLGSTRQNHLCVHSAKPKRKT